MKKVFEKNIIENKEIIFKGQSLFEVVLALAVSVIIIMAIVSLASKSVTTSTYSNNNSQAARYVGEAMEYMRKEKEFGSWNTLKTAITAGSGQWCMTDLSLTNSHACNPFNSSDNIPNTIFQRTATASATASTINIDIGVTWFDEKGFHRVNTTGAISNK